MQARVHACTTRSRTHERNEDRAVVGDLVLASTVDVEHSEVEGPAIIAVLDGLGGHPAGDVASEFAGRLLAEAEFPADEDGTTELVQRADVALQDAMRDVPERFGMGTTVALLALEADGHAMVANVGDSSVWRLADGERLARLTVSDRDEGSRIRQCLGARGEYLVDPHTDRVRVAPGERFLLATDGLTDVVPPELIEAALRDDIEHAAENLFAQVDESGRPDDVTIVVIETLAD
jgi:PPM family protein phosphatase